MRDKIGSKTIKERSRRLNDLGTELWGSYLDQQIGQELDVLTLKQLKKSTTQLEVSVTTRPRFPGRFIYNSNVPLRVKITHRSNAHLHGSVVTS